MLAKKFALGFGLAVILPLVVHYGVSTFSPPPKYKDYVIEDYGNKYSAASADEKKILEKEYKAMQEKRENHSKRFERNLFFVAVPVGLLSILLGSLIGIQAIGSGLMFGGIFVITDGYYRYWSQLDDVIKFVSFLAAFVLLIIIGYKKITDNASTNQRGASNENMS